MPAYTALTTHTKSTKQKTPTDILTNHNLNIKKYDDPRELQNYNRQKRQKPRSNRYYPVLPSTNIKKTQYCPVLPSTTRYEKKIQYYPVLPITTQYWNKNNAVLPGTTHYYPATRWDAINTPLSLLRQRPFHRRANKLYILRFGGRIGIEWVR